MLVRGKSLRDWYGALMKCYMVGYGAVFGRIYGIINVVLLGSSYFILKGFNPGFFETIVIGIFLVFALFIGGFIFVKLDLQKAEQKSMFNENPQQKEMYEKILVMSDQIQSINEYLAKKANEELNENTGVGKYNE